MEKSSSDNRTVGPGGPSDPKDLSVPRDRMDPIIIIPGPGDTKLGYLNNANVHFPFEVENKTWPTVEHFMLAKRFEGTTLEEEIRKSKNIYKARILAKPRKIIVEEDGRLIKKIVFGRVGTTVEERSDWNEVKQNYLEIALRAKFSHGRIMNRLLRTEGIRLIDTDADGSDSVNGAILENIRDEILEKRAAAGKKTKVERKFTTPFADIKSGGGSNDAPSGALTREETALVDSIFRGIDILKSIELSIPKNILTLEMFEDVFYNLLGGPGDEKSLEQSTEILNVIKTWIDERSARWTDVTRNMPNYESLVRNIEDMIKGKFGNTFVPHSSSKGTTVIKISIFIATIIRWLRMDATTKERNEFFRRHSLLKKENFVLPPLRRSYRSYSILPYSDDNTEKRKSVKKNTSTKLVSSAKRGARYIEIFRKDTGATPASAARLSSEDFSTVTNILEKMTRRERKSWLENYQKLDILKQKEQIKNIILKSASTEKDA